MKPLTQEPHHDPVQASIQGDGSSAEEAEERSGQLQGIPEGRPAPPPPVFQHDPNNPNHHNMAWRFQDSTRESLDFFWNKEDKSYERIVQDWSVAIKCILAGERNGAWTPLLCIHGAFKVHTSRSNPTVPQTLAILDYESRRYEVRRFPTTRPIPGSDDRQVCGVIIEARAAPGSVRHSSGLGAERRPRRRQDEPRILERTERENYWEVTVQRVLWFNRKSRPTPLQDLAELVRDRLKSKGFHRESDLPSEAIVLDIVREHPRRYQIDPIRVPARDGLPTGGTDFVIQILYYDHHSRRR